MKVYHGSVIKITDPDISYSHRYLDFGQGFYLTTYKAQAEKWALRKAMRSGGKAVVNIYDFNQNAKDITVKRFIDDGSWLDFICNCRRGNDESTADIIIGPVADDDVFKTVDLYFRGLWDRERALKEIRYYKKNDQIAVKNNEAIRKTLVFRASYEVN